MAENKLLTKWIKLAERGTSGDMVWDILRDWEADVDRIREVVKGISNPYFIVVRVGMVTVTSYNEYPEFEVFEEARQAVLKELDAITRS